MTVCRYFLQGTCRFGDRCRFEHTERNYDQRNAGNYQQQQGYGQSNYYRPGNEYRNDRYDSNDYYDRQRNYSPDRYSDNYRSNAYNQQYNRFKKDYEEYPPYIEPNYSRNQQYSDNRNVNTYGQNRFRWLSDDYRKEAQQNIPRENKFTNQQYSTSTPKSKVPFSFKVPESEIKKDSGFSHYQVNEQDQLQVERVKEDAVSWEFGGLWPFTCYFPYTDKDGFPGFWDVSPEELRYAAYKAEENNAYDSYVNIYYFFTLKLEF